MRSLALHTRATKKHDKLRGARGLAARVLREGAPLGPAARRARAALRRVRRGHPRERRGGARDPTETGAGEILIDSHC